MKNNILQHLTIRLGIPALIFFLIWQIGDADYGSLENLLQILLIISFIAFIIVLLLLMETLRFHQDQRRIERNINIALLVLHLPFFGFMLFASYAIANF